MQKSLLTRGFTERNVTTVTIAPNGSVILNLQIYMPPGIGLTDGAPSAWQLQLDGKLSHHSCLNNCFGCVALTIATSELTGLQSPILI